MIKVKNYLRNLNKKITDKAPAEATSVILFRQKWNKQKEIKKLENNENKKIAPRSNYYYQQQVKRNINNYDLN